MDEALRRVKNIYVGHHGEAVLVWSREKGWVNKELYDKALRLRDTLTKVLIKQITEKEGDHA